MLQSHCVSLGCARSFPPAARLTALFPRAAPAQTFATKINAPWQRIKATAEPSDLKTMYSSSFMGGRFASLVNGQLSLHVSMNLSSKSIFFLKGCPFYLMDTNVKQVSLEM